MMMVCEWHARLSYSGIAGHSHSNVSGMVNFQKWMIFDLSVSSSRIVVTPGLMWLQLQETEMLFLGLGVSITGNYKNT